jgi:hypothetical protein
MTEIYKRKNDSEDFVRTEVDFHVYIDDYLYYSRRGLFEETLRDLFRSWSRPNNMVYLISHEIVPQNGNITEDVMGLFKEKLEKLGV